MASVSLLSVNIERSKHLERVIPFLAKAQAEVICVQELMERDVEAIEKATGTTCYFSPRCVFLARPGEETGIEGQGIFSRLPVVERMTEFYAGEHDPIAEFGSDKLQSILRIARALTSVEVEKDGERFRIVTTHFTWTPDGQASDTQRTDLRVMAQYLTGKEFVLCGDFNAPRGLEIFDALSNLYTDNIPASYETSIDALLHRRANDIKRDALAAGLKGYMVDGMFTTTSYSASNVSLHSGVSDHMAVSATIARSR